jgi:hypothetical protein
VWTYIEIQLTISTAAGAGQILFNGTSVLSISSVNTQGTLNNTVDSIVFQGAAPGLSNTFFDDVYILDTTAASPLNTFLGQVRVYGQAPNANSAVGGRNAWTATNPTNINWSNVANVPYNASEYKFSDTSSQYDMFRFPPVPLTVSVLFLNEWSVVETDNTSATTVRSCFTIHAF